MKYVIGIDSGGTKFRVLARNLDGKDLGEFTGATGSHYYLEHDEMLRRINYNIDSCLALFGGKRMDCAYILCGTTGLDSPEDGVFLNEVYRNLPGFSCPAECINDAELAHHTVLGTYGALLISGTGSIAFGRNKKNETARIGGWLFSILGDEGSGTWISRQALRQLGRFFDGALPDGPMFTLIRENLNIHSPKELQDYAAKIATPPWTSPALAHLTDQAAGAGDREAQKILKSAALEIFKLLEDLVFVLNLEDEGEFNIGIWGSCLVKSSQVQGEFRNLVQKRYPSGRIILPTQSAVQGAAELAFSRLAGNPQSVG
jgi:N-acetylglucosamine kinase-like BadF-type ATPase